MRILFPLGAFYPAQSGGPCNTNYWHTKALVNNGISPVVITTNHDLVNNTDIEFNKWLSLDCGATIYTKKKISHLPLRLIWMSIWKIKSSNIIHLSSLFYPPSWIIAFFSILFKKKIVWSVRGELNENALKYSKTKKRIILKWIKILSENKNITFHATSDAEFRHIKELFGEKKGCFQLPNFIELPPRLKKDSLEKYFLFIGRIHPIKALDNLIKALDKSSEFRSSSFQFKIAGNADNEYGTELKKLVSKLGLSEKVQFLGHVEGQQKQELYVNAYFKILPSHTENFGNVIAESLSQGTPVIAAKGTPWEVLEEYNAGRWVNNSIDELAATIDEVINIDESSYNIMRSNCYELVEEKFDVEKNIYKWINKYQSITSE